jgi:hypothetical protein
VELGVQFDMDYGGESAFGNRGGRFLSPLELIKYLLSAISVDNLSDVVLVWRLTERYSL